MDARWIRPNPRQPRQVFEEEALPELVASLKEVGLLQPVVVRRVGKGSYEFIMCERRWRAVQALLWRTPRPRTDRTGWWPAWSRKGTRREA